MIVKGGNFEISMTVSKVTHRKVIDRFDKNFGKEIIFEGENGEILRLKLVASDTKPLIPSMWEYEEEAEKRGELDETGKE